MSQPDPVVLLSVFKDIYYSRLLGGVALTLAVYDWFLTFSDEFETIYQSRWTLPKVLFFYIRIVTPPGLVLAVYQMSDLRGPLSDKFCTAWAMIQVFSMLTSLVAANALLALRLIALYRRKATMVWFIRGFFFTSYAVTAAVMIEAMIRYSDSLHYSTTIGRCGAQTASNTFPAVFYAPLAFEVTVFVLTAYRGWQDSKIITGAGSAPFLMILYRDGFISFLVMVAIRIWNIWIHLTQPLSSWSLGVQLMWAINTVLTTRVYMNLVWLAKKPIVEQTSNVPMPGGGIRMHVHTFTEVQTDNWKPRIPNASGSVEDGFEPRRY